MPTKHICCRKREAERSPRHVFDCSLVGLRSGAVSRASTTFSKGRRLREENNSGKDINIFDCYIRDHHESRFKESKKRINKFNTTTTNRKRNQNPTPINRKTTTPFFILLFSYPFKSFQNKPALPSSFFSNPNNRITTFPSSIYPSASHSSHPSPVPHTEIPPSQQAPTSRPYSSPCSPLK